MADFVPIILTVDDDPHLLALIEHHIHEWGYIHCGACSSSEMWKGLEQTIPTVILLDIALGDADGIDLVSQLKQRFPSVPIIMITANATIEAAVKSLKNGAYDFLCKPLNFDRLHIEIDKAIQQNRLVLQVKAFECASRRTDFHGMIGRSEPMRKVYRLIETVGPTDAAVLILGETGTGKELTARAAMDALIDLGRPKAIRLAVLVDRLGRELPIQADYAGCKADAEPGKLVQVSLVESDGKDEVVIE